MLLLVGEGAHENVKYSRSPPVWANSRITLLGALVVGLAKGLMKDRIQNDKNCLPRGCSDCRTERRGKPVGCSPGACRTKVPV